MAKKKDKSFKTLIIYLVIFTLAIDVAMMIWAIRRDERYEAERQQKIEQCREGTYTYSQID